MSKCNFNIPFNGEPAGIFSKIKSSIEKQGGKFAGDHSAGTFSVNVLGNITGSYKILGQEIQVNILSSPIFIPCSQIESFLKSQLSK